MRALIIEDDAFCASNLAKALCKKGIDSDVCSLGEDGLVMMDSLNYDICILDLGLSDIEGNEVIQKIRFSKKIQQKNIPIIVVSSFQKSEDKVQAFMYGADDYITKPYENNEFVMRVLTAIRRSHGHNNNIIKAGDIQLNLNAKNVTINQHQVNLSSKEYGLFELLMLKKGSTLSKQFIIDSLYGGSHKIPTQKIVDVLICKIRGKFLEHTKKDCLKTIWGLGYKIDDDQHEI